MSSYWQQTHYVSPLPKPNLCPRAKTPPVLSTALTIPLQAAGDNGTGCLPDQSPSAQTIRPSAKVPDWNGAMNHSHLNEPLPVCVNTQPCVDAYRLTVLFMCTDVWRACWWCVCWTGKASGDGCPLFSPPQWMWLIRASNGGSGQLWWAPTVHDWTFVSGCHIRSLNVVKKWCLKHSKPWKLIFKQTCVWTLTCSGKNHE